MKTKQIKAAIEKEFSELKKDAELLTDVQITQIIQVVKVYKAKNKLTPANVIYTDSLIELYRGILNERETNKKE